jgi:hypothetical protein
MTYLQSTIDDEHSSIPSPGPGVILNAVNLQNLGLSQYQFEVREILQVRPRAPNDTCAISVYS